jgi:hypothetical protein
MFKKKKYLLHSEIIDGYTVQLYFYPKKEYCFEVERRSTGSIFLKKSLIGALEVIQQMKKEKESDQ